MEVVCSRHPHGERFLRDGVLLTYPDTLRVVLHLTAADFQQAIVHVDAPRGTADARPHRTIAGEIVLQRFGRTCALPFVSDQVRLDGEICCVTRLSFQDWLDDDDVAAYTSLVECRVRLSLVPWRRITRGDLEYVAVPIANLPPMTECVREGLCAARCH